MDKIAFLVLSTGWGGLEMNTLKLAGLFKNNKWEVSLIVSDTSVIFGESRNIFPTIALKKKSKFLGLKKAFLISSYLKENNIRILFVSDNKDLKIVSLVKRFFYKNLKVVYQQHMQIGINKKDLIHTLRYKSIDYWISPLEWLKKEVTERTNFPESKVKVIPIGVDIQKFSTHTYTKKDALQKLNINASAPLVGIIGRIAEKKGQHIIIQAVLELQKKGIAIEALIFGSPTVNDPSCMAYDKKLKQMVSDNGLTDIIHFREFTRDVALFYNAVDIFTIATESETYGMVTIEAMLSKLPVIGTNAGGTPEILQNGEYGFLFEYNNVSQYCERIQDVLNHPEETKNITDKAQEYAFIYFSQESEFQMIEALLR